MRKGYLELCLLSLIQSRKRVYGFEVLEVLKSEGLPVKEGTLYPILNRMTADGVLKSVWETEQTKGHPRKYYLLTPAGSKAAEAMREEFQRMVKILKELSKERS